jgi:hypothetical protein
MVRAAALIAWTLVGCASDRQVTTPPPARREPPRDLVENTFERYRSCRSYADRGVRVLRFEHDGFDAGTVPACALEERSEFSTAFDRATDAFKIDVCRKTCGLPERRGAIWTSPGGATHSWWSLRCTVKEEPVRTALQHGAPALDGVSTLVPELLLEGTGLTRFHLELLDAQYDGAEDVRGVPCSRFTLSDRRGKVTYWISEKQAVVRRFERRRFEREDLFHTRIGADGGEATEAHPFTAEETVDFDAVFDETIAPERFNFRPPERDENSAPSRDGGLLGGRGCIDL